MPWPLELPQSLSLPLRNQIEEVDLDDRRLADFFWISQPLMHCCTLVPPRAEPIHLISA